MGINIKIENKLNSLFPDPIQRDRAAQILAGYSKGRDKKNRDVAAASCRVNLAILKLISDKPSLFELEKTTNEALVDYKTILNKAELPRSSKNYDLSDSDRKELLKEDLEAYRVWLNT